jgi:hypothetical protein
MTILRLVKGCSKLDRIRCADNTEPGILSLKQTQKNIERNGMSMPKEWMKQ